MTWPEIPPSKPIPRGRVIAITTVAVAVTVATGVQGWRAGMRDADEDPAAACAGIVRAVTPVIAASHGQDTPGLQGVMRIVVDHPECFPRDIRDDARDLLDEPVATPG
jgi:hypothetical protein